jgi:hypothetical protein
MFYNSSQGISEVSSEEAGVANKISAQINEIGRNIEDLASYEVRVKVMEGGEKISLSSNPVKVAEWTKSVMDRLDALTDEPTREQILLNCGYNCILVNPRPLVNAKARRAKFPDEEAFLQTEVKKPPKGMRFEREGNVIVQYYTPHSFGTGMRCYCSLLRGLPAGQTASLTYCQCSRGFIQKYWEGILGRPVEVDLVESAISGAEQCKFVIHL